MSEKEAKPPEPPSKRSHVHLHPDLTRLWIDVLKAYPRKPMALDD